MKDVLRSKREAFMLANVNAPVFAYECPICEHTLDRHCYPGDSERCKGTTRATAVDVVTQLIRVAYTPCDCRLTMEEIVLNRDAGRPPTLAVAE